MAGPDQDAARFTWNICDHVCRVCQGRVVKRRDNDGGVYRCTNCGLEVRGRSVSALCCCGLALRTGRNMGVRCMPNPNPSPECPSEIVAQVAEVPTMPADDGDAAA